MARPKINDKAKEEEEEVDTRPLHIAYRPQELDSVIGHKSIVSSLRNILKSKSPPHAYLFTGPSGIGKTTLARIVCRALNVPDQAVLEVDAATYAQVEMIRQITQMVAYPSLGGNPLRGVIIDEAHAISKASWQALLKPIEEPPAHVFWVLCTTEEDKVPLTIRTRCHAYALRPIDEDELSDFVTAVADNEKYKITDEAIGAVIDKAAGSPRQALQFLSVCRDCETRKEALQLIDKASESEPVLSLARMLATKRGLTWKNVLLQIKQLEGEEPEGVRLAIISYLTKCVAGCINEAEAVYLLKTMANFESPFPSNQKLAPLLLACGRCVFGGEE